MELWFADTGQEASMDCDSKRRKTSTIAPNYCSETASILYVAQREGSPNRALWPSWDGESEVEVGEATVARICGEEYWRGERWTGENSRDLQMVPLNLCLNIDMSMFVCLLYNADAWVSLQTTQIWISDNKAWTANLFKPPCYPWAYNRWESQE